MANASGFRGPKQGGGYFVPLGNCVGSIFNYSGASGTGGSYLPGNFTAADWTAANATTGAGALLSTISSIGQGGLLRDMGRTVVSSNRTFRKVQLLTPSSGGALLSTDGVTNAPYTTTSLTQTSSSASGYLTGYIELATGRAGPPRASVAPVAYMPGLM